MENMLGFHIIIVFVYRRKANIKCKKIYQICVSQKKLMENVYNSDSAVASIGIQNNIIVAAHNIF